MINFRTVLSMLDGELLTEEGGLEVEFSEVFASDLMSDVLAFSRPGSLLLTGLVNEHVVRTACLADVAAVVFIQGKRPDKSVVDEANEIKIPLLATGLSMVDCCARIAALFPGSGR